MITQERLKELVSYDPETGWLTWQDKSRCKRAEFGDRAGWVNWNGYIRLCLDYRIYVVHRLAWLYVHGEWPIEMLDHINGDRSDNRISNLRLANKSENQQNKRKAASNSKTGLLGAFPSDGRFRAKIVLGKKAKNLGMHDTAEEAHTAYLLEKRKIHNFCTI